MQILVNARKQLENNRKTIVCYVNMADKLFSPNQTGCRYNDKVHVQCIHLSGCMGQTTVQITRS